MTDKEALEWEVLHAEDPPPERYMDDQVDRMAELYTAEDYPTEEDADHVPSGSGVYVAEQTD